MGAVTTLLATVAAAAGAVAVYRYADRKAQEMRDAFKSAQRRAGAASTTVLDYERDPASGVFKPKA